MKQKLIVAFAAIMACSLGLRAELAVLTGTFATTATQTVYTNFVQVGGAGLNTPLGESPAYRQIEKIVIKNNTLSSSSTTVEMLDIADWTTLGGSPVVATTTAQTVLYPVRSVTETITGGYVVTNYPVEFVTAAYTTYVTTNYPVQFETAGEGTTNYYMVDVLVPVEVPAVTNVYMQTALAATTETVTKNAPYWANRLRLITTLDQTNAVSSLQWAVHYHK